MHEIELVPGRLTSRGRLYEAVYRGEALCVHRDPEHEACRILKNRGVSGRVVFRWRGSPFVAVSGDVTALASLSAREGQKDSIREVRYREFTGIRGEGGDGEE